MKSRNFYSAQIGIITFFLFADQNLMGPNLTLIANEFNMVQEKDLGIGGLIPLVFWLLGGVVSIIIGYYTDLLSRKNLFVLIVIVGEIPCLLSGLSTSYNQFFIARVLTGIGIGGIIPLTYSLLGDLYKSNERIIATTLIGLSAGLGIAIGQLSSGLLGDLYGWRLPFIIFAIPNLILGILFFFTFVEPIRGKMDVNVKKFEISNIHDVLSLFKIKTNLLVFLQGIFGTIPWGVFSVFMIDYFVIDKEYDKAFATLVITLVGAMALVGSLFGGYLGNYLYKKNPKYLPLFCGISTILGVLPTYFLINAPNNTNDNSLLIIYAILSGLLIAVTSPNMKAILMNVNNPHGRGTVFSLYNFSDDLGRGFGPFIIGLLSYNLGRNLAFNIANVFWLICGIFILMMVKTFPKEELKKYSL